MNYARANQSDWFSLSLMCLYQSDTQPGEIVIHVQLEEGFITPNATGGFLTGHWDNSDKYKLNIWIQITFVFSYFPQNIRQNVSFDRNCWSRYHHIIVIITCIFISKHYKWTFYVKKKLKNSMTELSNVTITTDKFFFHILTIV